MTVARDDLTKSVAILIAALEVNVPELVTARKANGDFRPMIRSELAAKLNKQGVVRFPQEIVEETGLTVLFVTHDRELADKVSTCLIKLSARYWHDS